MSNTEVQPDETICRSQQGPQTRVEVLDARLVPLGGPRAMTVHRTLPQRDRSLIGAWCFIDHFDSDDVSRTGGMDVAPHPHTGLQTVSWLFDGVVEHRDSHGMHAFVRPGEMNLMTAGAGICHSEVSTPQTRALRGVQLWIAMPDRDRHGPRHFQHHVAEPVRVPGGVVRVLLGSLAGHRSPVATFSPLVAAQVDIEPGSTVELSVDRQFEHGVLVDLGPVDVLQVPVEPKQLAYLPVGSGTIAIANPHPQAARVMVLGGTPFDEDVLMWWNFLGRTHEEIVAYRQEWESGHARFGTVHGYLGERERLPAPELPPMRLRPRKPARSSDEPDTR